MTNILGPYYSPWHWRGEDERYMRELDPAWINIHQPTARAIHTAQRNAPNARIMLRSWDIDDHNGDRKREMYADPKGAARKHLEMWQSLRARLIAELNTNEWAFDESKWHYGLVNEPDPAFVPQVVEYSLEAMRIAQEWGWHLGVVASSVGNFKKPSEGPEGWTQFMPLERPINDGGHILLVHEYWQPEGPSFGEDGGNLAWRHHSIPLDVPILIREAGANGYIYGRYSKEDDSGWQKTVKDPKPETFAAQVKEYIEGCDQRVQGVCLYMLDFHSKQWQSFDTQPAMEQLLAIKGARPQVPSPFAKKPTKTILPIISNGTPSTAYVAVPAGANIRSKPVLGDILTAVPHGEKVAVIGYDKASQWFQVEYGGVTGWTRADLLSEQEPSKPEQPKPVEQKPVGDNWQRSRAFVRRWEGGFQDLDWDIGNWTGCAVGKGIKKGTNFGISACSYPDLDIRNLTIEQADEIYYRDYWLASGADKLPWPLCLVVFDTAVNFHPSTAKAWLEQSGGNVGLYVALRLRGYRKSKAWPQAGNAWVDRVIELLQEAAKD